MLAGLLAIMAPSAFANQGNVTLDSAIVDAPEKGWYSSGDIVSISGIISNNGDATSITVDPSCNEVLRVWDEGNLIFDGTKNCVGQSRGLDLGADSETETETLTWDLRNDDGELVPSGDYTIEHIIPGEGLSSSVTIHAQTPNNIPEGLEMEVVATSRTGIHFESSPSLITVRLVNTQSEIIDLNFGECKLIINEVLFGECGPRIIGGKEILTVAQIPIKINAGENRVSVSLGDNSLNQELSIIGYVDESITNYTPVSSQIKVALNTMQQTEFRNSEIFSSEIGVTNNGTSEDEILFTNSCFGEIWIVDSSGEVVRDSREFKECTEFEAEYSILPGESITLAQGDWDFIDRNGCHVAPGKFTVMVEIPEFRLFSTQQVSYLGEVGTYCVDDTAYFEPTLSGDDYLVISPVVHNSGNEEITFFSSCMLFTTLVGDGEVVNDWGTHCENDKPYSTSSEIIEFEEMRFNLDYLEDGEYSLIFETLSAPKVRSVIPLTWPLVGDETQDLGSETENVEDTTLWTVTGSWSSTTSDLGTCWLLNTPDGQILTLTSAIGLVSWSPSIGSVGEYLVYDSDSAPECSQFATNSFTIQEVYYQTEIVTEEEEVVVVIETPVDSTEQEINPAVITVGIAVASTGILSLLVAGIATNESWRIPATSAGLWLLGLVGRTSETSDGRYQRGRLMGYLTANPGCHFRALMAALEMSNGQITHHLKILEDEGRIWRRADGRLVRFYPYTSNLHPGVLDQDLPMPPLSPDPNSLQGKILRLLDDDGQMKKFPTQAELAHRLDRSQQLVSHHLRTLQKYGLVQKQKSGMKNRYCLTKEALFLLETTEL